MFQLLKAQSRLERYGLQLLNSRVCQRSFRLLLGMGKGRMQRLRKAVLRGDDIAPMDLRCVPKQHSTLPKNSARSVVIEFLESLWHCQAEPLPEAMHDTRDFKLKSKVRRRGKRPRHFHRRETFKTGYSPNMKFLPPGTIGDYLEQFRGEYPAVKVSRKLFTLVPCSPNWSLLITEWDIMFS